jgi:hypothetical protein
VNHGFARAAGGTFTTFEAPGAGTGSFEGTIPVSINTGGAIAGYYYDASDVYHGFVRPASGTITDFAPDTQANSINSEGDVTGYGYDASGVYYGFLLTP